MYLKFFKSLEEFFNLLRWLKNQNKPLNKFIKEQKTKTLIDVSLLIEFLRAKNKARKVEEIPTEELNGYSSEFIVAIRRKDGKEFEPSSLKRANLQL